MKSWSWVEARNPTSEKREEREPISHPLARRTSSYPLARRSGERVRERGPRREESARVMHPRAQALAIATALLPLACSGTNSSADGEPIQSPADQTGGYIVATVPAGMGTPRATLFDSGGAQLGSFVADAPGAGLSFWWTSAPGQTTRVSLRDDGGADIKYDLTSNYTPVADAFEPNDAMDVATPMPDGGQMSAFLFAGRRGAMTDPAAYDDYFRFTAQAGALSIQLDSVPADLAARMFLLRADGSEVARVSSGLKGAALALNPPALADAGELVVKVSLWDEAPPVAGAGTEVPASFTQAYRLTVSQSQ